MLCEIEANQFFFMSEKHVLMASANFFSFTKGWWGGGCGVHFSVGASYLDGRGHPTGHFKKIVRELGRRICLTNYEKPCNMVH